MFLSRDLTRGAQESALDGSTDYIDEQGFRANVGIIVTDGQGRVLIAGRRGRGGWQFPQGGVRRDETTEAAMYRELREEVGLGRADVRSRRPDPGLASVPAARPVHPARTHARLHRPEAAMVPASARRGPGTAALRSHGRAGVRPVPLGGLLAPSQGSDLFQASGVRARPDRARPAGLPGQRSARSALVVAAALAARAEARLTPRGVSAAARGSLRPRRLGRPCDPALGRVGAELRESSACGRRPPR